MAKVYGGKGTISWAETQKLLKKGLQLENGEILSLVDVKDLKIDHSYQRGIVRSNTDRIYREFEPNAVGIFQVGQRVDTRDLNVIDGQNRLQAILKRDQQGKTSPKQVLAVVATKTTVSQEATKFVLFNANKPVVGNSKFRARLSIKGAEPEQSINKIAKSEGFALCFLAAGRRKSGDNGMNGIFSISYLTRAHGYGEANLKLAFQFLREFAGNGEADMVPENLRDGRVVLGVAMFLASQNNPNVKALCKTFSRYSLERIWEDSNTRTSNAVDKPTTDHGRPAYLCMRMQRWLY